MEFRWIDKEQYDEDDGEWSSIESADYDSAAKKAAWITMADIGEQYEYHFSLIVQCNELRRIFDIDVIYEPNVSITTNGTRL